MGCSSTATGTCTTPATPSFNSATKNISTGQTVSYTISNADSGRLYTIVDASNPSISYGVSKIAAGTSVTLPSSTFTSAGTYNVKMMGLSTESSTCNCNSVSASIVVSATALPLTLLSFTGTYEGTAARLGWTTANEILIDHFTIERSTDGRDFKAIDKVMAAGAGNGTHAYSYTDGVAPDKAYYRLAIIQQDGSLQYSNTIALSRNGSLVNTATIMPNPFGNELMVAVSLDQEASIDIRITDMFGNMVKSGSYNAQKGLNNVKVSSLDALKPGLYLVQVLKNNSSIGRSTLEKR
jgi:hypothetical protein